MNRKHRDQLEIVRDILLAVDYYGTAQSTRIIRMGNIPHGLFKKYISIMVPRLLIETNKRAPYGKVFRVKRSYTLTPDGKWMLRLLTMLYDYFKRESNILPPLWMIQKVHELDNQTQARVEK